MATRFRGLATAGIMIGLASLPASVHAVNHCLRYDGVNDVLRPGACLPISGDAPFTLEFWVLRRPGGGTWQELGDSRGYSFFIHSSSRLYLNLASPGQSGAPACCYLGAASTYTRYRSNATVPVGTWAHIAVVWDGVEPVAYVNGMADPMVFDITQNSFTCCDFGDSQACITPDPAQITVDEIRAWDHARDADEIAATMFTLLNGEEEGLIAYWPMDEGVGQVTADRAGDNDLQLGVSANPDPHDPMWDVSEWLPPVPVRAATWGKIKADRYH